MIEIEKKINQELKKSLELRRASAPPRLFGHENKSTYYEVLKIRKKQDEHYRKWLFYKNLNKEFNKGEEK